MNTTYKIVVFYLAAAAVWAWNSSTYQTTLIGLVFALVLMVVHLALYQRRINRVDWGTVANPVAVIDWGHAGRELSLPDHLAGQFILCPAKDVEKTMDNVRRELEAAKNGLYLKKGLPVYAVYFRKGDRCNETQEEYINQVVIPTMNAARIEWHKKMEQMDKYYLKTFLQSHLNGSVYD
jgi:hypothetical protein